jgi:hypothetical protein
MLKERKTAQQLSELISTRIGVDGVYITVRQDHAYGWQPTVVSAPSNALGFQRRVEEIAHQLRHQFDLQI